MKILRDGPASDGPASDGEVRSKKVEPVMQLWLRSMLLRLTRQPPPGPAGPFWRLVYSNRLERSKVNELLAIFVRVFDSKINVTLALVHRANHLLTSPLRGWLRQIILKDREIVDWYMGQGGQERQGNRAYTRSEVCFLRRPNRQYDKQYRAHMRLDKRRSGLAIGSPTSAAGTRYNFQQVTWEHRTFRITFHFFI